MAFFVGGYPPANVVQMLSRSGGVSTISNLNIKRAWPDAAVYNNAVYVCGGYNENTIVQETCERLQLSASGTPVGTWQMTTPLPTPMMQACMFTLNNKVRTVWIEEQSHCLQRDSCALRGVIRKLLQLYHVGGYAGNLTMYAQVYSYEDNTRQWTPAPSLPIPLFNHACTVFNDKAFLCGGRSTVGIGFGRSEQKSGNALQRTSLSAISAMSSTATLGRLRIRSLMLCL